MDEIAHYAREHKLSFPVLKDAGNTIADQFAAARTPEVLRAGRGSRGALLRPHRRPIRFPGSGHRLSSAMSRSVAIWQVALDELLAGKPVSQPLAAAQGCLIGRVREPVANSDVTYANQISRILNAQLRGVPSPGTDRAVPAHLVRRDGRLGRNDSRSDRRAPHAPLARRSGGRPFQQRRPSDRRRAEPDRPLGQERRAGRRHQATARAAEVHRRVADRRAGPDHHDGRRRLRRSGRRNGRLPALCHRSRLGRRQVDQDASSASRAIRPSCITSSSTSFRRASLRRVAPAACRPTGWRPLPPVCAKSRWPTAWPATSRRVRS